MELRITFKQEILPLNDIQLERLIDFGIWIAEDTAAADERVFIERLKEMRVKTCLFMKVHGINIERDFTDIAERKFWSRVFFDTSRAIYARKLGVHEICGWQAQAIHQAYAAGLIFEHAAKETDPQWSASTLDRREFDKCVNRTGA